MINAVFIMFFLFYSILLCFIHNILLLLCFLIFNLVVAFIIKIDIKKIVLNIKNNILFILMIFLCNLLFCSFMTAFITTFRLFIIINFSFIFSYKFSSDKIISGFYYLFYPLKFIGVDVRSLSVVIAISLSFIPILVAEAKSIKLSLISKGFDFNLKNVILRPHIYLITFINSLFDRVYEIEKCLKIKGFE